MSILSLNYVAFFVIVALGIVIGNIKIRGISLDLSAIIFVALVFGHFGVKMPPIIQQLGLIFFIYSVGIQAGPGFFESFKKDGMQLIVVTAFVVISAAAITLLFSYIFDVDRHLAVGLFSGALTSTPGLAAAIDSTQSPLASIGYGIAYPLGVLAVILFVKVAPRLMKINVAAEEHQYNMELGAGYPEITHRNFIVENRNIFGKSLGELKIRTMTHTNVSRVMHEGEAFTPSADTVLWEGDRIRAVGTLKDLEKTRLLIGRETSEDIPLSNKYAISTFLVTNEKIVNKSLGQIGLFEQYNATCTAIRRAGIDITPDASSKLRFGDKVRIALAEDNMDNVKKLLGDNRKRINDLELLPISVGIIIGVLIGTVEFPLLGIQFKLGLTGGVLISAILLSRIGKTGNIVWNASGPANQMLRKIGLIFFLVSVGTHAGETLLETLRGEGIDYFLMGAAITIIPMVIAVVLGHFFLHINFLTLIGALTGAMTSTPALSAVEPLTESNAPKVAYAAVYPFALVLIIICSQVISKL